MRTFAAIFWIAILLFSLLATDAAAQRTYRGYQPTVHSKVPAVSAASYHEPEPAPAPVQESAPNPEPRQNRKPPSVRRAAHQAMPGEMMMAPPGHGAPAYEMNPPDMQYDDMSYGEGCAAGCEDSCCCEPCGPDPCCTIWENLQLFAGVQGFKAPVDLGLNGNFGFHEGINWGGPLFEYGGIGGQIGVQAVQSNLDESANFEDNRNQIFFTTGLFHRPFDNDGWQGGVVFDWLHDDFFVQMDVGQLRAEISWLDCGHHEIGGWVAVATTSDSDEFEFEDEFEGEVSWEPIDMYALFYRTHFCGGGSGRFSAGFTGEGDGLVGADILAPLDHNCALVAGANYIIASEDNDDEEDNFHGEAWGLTISLVWFPGYHSPCSPKNAYRPLFDVANNNWMMLKQGRHENFD